MNNLVKILVGIAAGSLIGLISAQRMADGTDGFFVRKEGPWKSWPQAGTRFANPYARAHFVLTGRLPLSRFNVSEFEATRDGQGALLDADCTYIVSGKMPATRWWSLYITNSDYEYAGPHSGLTSSQMVNSKPGTFRITISKAPHAGNWIGPATRGNFVLVLRYYNPVRSITSLADSGNLPRIKRRTCR